MVSYHPPIGRTVFELAQVLQVSKKITSIAPMRHLSRNKHWPYVKIGYLHHFYVLSLSLILGRFIYQYCDTDTNSLKLPLPSSPICPIYLLYIYYQRQGEIPSFKALYKLFLSHIKVSILINSWYFLCFAWMCLLLFLNWHHQFPVNERC